MVCTKENQRKGCVGNMREVDSELYTFEEARAYLKTSKQKMRQLLDSKQIKAFKIGKYNWLISKEAVAGYIDSRLSE